MRLADYPEIPEMHDRLIAAATDRLGATLITTDQKVQSSPRLTWLWLPGATEPRKINLGNFSSVGHPPSAVTSADSRGRLFHIQANAKPGQMPGDLTPTPGTNRKPIRASGGDSRRREREQRPGFLGARAKPEKIQGDRAVRNDRVGSSSVVSWYARPVCPCNNTHDATLPLQ